MGLQEEWFLDWQWRNAKGPSESGQAKTASESKL
tara:strand:+ start:1003 stop:1104 length:102 start_codon:yes stop_codon:yes gene_type:complete